MSERKTHAVVIGLSRYELEDWTLTAPVPDALDFARWLLSNADVEPSGLTLILSPRRDDDLGEFEGRYTPATATVIRDALLRYAHEEASKPQRLFVFYAGHAIGREGATPDEGPVLLPPEETNIKNYLVTPTLAFQVFRDALRADGPDEQIIFIDACRSPRVVDTNLHAVSFLFDVGVPSAGAQQALLYGTSNGDRAHQLERGLFSQALLSGLRGRAHLEFDVTTRKERLTFPNLVKYVIDEVDELAIGALGPVTQVPTPAGQPDLLLQLFDERPTATLTIHVRPAAVLSSATIEVVSGRTDVQSVRPPAAGDTNAFEVPLTEVAYQVRAPTKTPFSETRSIYRDTSVTAFLETARGLESVVGRLETIPPGDAVLELVSADRLARYEVIDSQGQRMAAGTGQGSVPLSSGLYQVKWSLPGEGVIQTDRVELRPGRMAHPLALNRGLPLDILDNLDPAAAMGRDQGMVELGDAFAKVALRRLGTLLSYAAAATWSTNHGQKLRSLGVASVEVPAGGSTFLFLAGDANRWEPRLTDNLRLARASVKGGGDAELAVDPIRGLSDTVQATGEVPRSGASLRITSAVVGELLVPLPFISDALSVVILTREADGALELHRYLYPGTPSGVLTDEVRLREAHWRALARREPIDDLEALVASLPTLDPLTAAVVGYRMHAAGVLQRWRVDEASVGRVPDYHVLRALLDADPGAGERALAALADAPPLLSEGFMWMHRWLTERAERAGAVPPLPARRPLTSELWTTFDGRADESPSATPRAIAVSVLDGISTDWARTLRQAIDDTIRIEVGNERRDLRGTGWLPDEMLVTLPDVVRSPGLVALTGDRRLGLDAAGTEVDAGDPLARVVQARLQSFHRAPRPPRPEVRAPRPGQRIAVIGYSTTSVDTPLGFVPSPVGEKYVLLGQITRVARGRVEYDARVVDGMGGGPVVDLETGEVVAVHVGVTTDASGARVAYGVPLVLLAANPAWR